MDYLTGHILSAWLLTGCYTACFSPVLLPSVSLWQLAHLIYLIGLVQSVGNVLKANQGDGGTSAGDIVSQVWKWLEKLHKREVLLAHTKVSAQVLPQNEQYVDIWRINKIQANILLSLKWIHMQRNQICEITSQDVGSSYNIAFYITANGKGRLAGLQGGLMQVLSHVAMN